MTKIYETTRNPFGFSNHAVNTNLGNLSVADDNKKGGLTNINFANDISYQFPISQYDSDRGSNVSNAQLPTNLHYYMRESNNIVSPPPTDNSLVFAHSLFPNELNDVFSNPIPDVGSIWTNNTSVLGTPTPTGETQEIGISDLAGTKRIENRLSFQFKAKLITDSLGLPTVGLNSGFMSDALFDLTGFRIVFLISSVPHPGSLHFNIFSPSALTDGDIHLESVNPDSLTTFTYDFGFELNEYELTLYVDNKPVRTLKNLRDYNFDDVIRAKDLVPFTLFKIAGSDAPGTKANLIPKRLTAN